MTATLSHNYTIVNVTARAKGMNGHQNYAGAHFCGPCIMAPMVYDEDGMGKYRQLILDKLEELTAAGVVTSLANWCNQAGIAEGTVRNFLRGGESRSLSIKSYIALAKIANTSVGALLGEEAPNSEMESMVLQGFRVAPQEGKDAIIAQARRELAERKKKDEETATFTNGQAIPSVETSASPSPIEEPINQRAKKKVKSPKR